ncbi:DUF2283 domain-containing protein [Alkalihalophilus lindianensis]|uniref:DUF2283 domain-containing protein n=1 Tax=Alkalihalophilus lindianensis TaxID=1630542 RepID=A0ABU3X620_9BACI|nr:DUF2283 domain-containing protein [Alkalihalophilus lindianensis]MDV2682874.1 DUF2283 domain-containing protein [Alkalihalophilus lindianensis]
MVITYDADAEMAYIYLAKPATYEIIETTEVEENVDCMIDIGREIPVVGIEVGGRSAEKLAYVKRENNHFTRVVTEVGDEFFLLVVEDQPITKSVAFGDEGAVSLLFSDKACTNFIGVRVRGEKYRGLDDL